MIPILHLYFPGDWAIMEAMKHKWIWAWAIQFAEATAAGLLAALAFGWSAILYGVLLWGGVPLAGLLSACRAVQRGLNNYLAWLIPAPCLYAAHRLVWGFAPSAGAGLLTAFLSLVGAAAGQVLVQRGGRR